MWWIALVSAEELAAPLENVEMNELEQQVERLESLQIRVKKLEEEISMQSDFAQQDAEIVSHLSVLVDSRQLEKLRIQAVQQLAQYHSAQVLPFLWEVLDPNDSNQSFVVSSFQITYRNLHQTQLYWNARSFGYLCFRDASLQCHSFTWKTDIFNP